MSARVLYRPKPGEPVTRIKLDGDPFDVLAWVFAYGNPNVDMRPDAPLPAWDAAQRKRLAEDRARKGRA